MFAPGLVAVVLWLLVATPAGVWAAVHDGGVAACNLCHVMHESENRGQEQAYSGRALLTTGPASDICLNCHATNSGAVMANDPLLPAPERGAGNFIFLLSDNLNDGPDGLTNPIPGDAAGHNLKAPGHGLATDGTRLTSPGGNYQASTLKCTSCHDPHGNTSYRMLRGRGTRQGSGNPFLYDAPLATGTDVDSGGVESQTSHAAYISGMSLWCANCHFDYLDDHNQGLSNFTHPTDAILKTEQVQQYNLYRGTLDPTGDLYGTSYLAAVPFEDPGNGVSTTNGPSASSRLMCLTCHRAHATSAPHAGRWDFNVSNLGADGVVSGSYAIPNPYLDPGQAPLCWKCHADGGN